MSSSRRVLSAVHAYEDVWSAGLVLLLVIAGLGYAVDAFGVVLFAGYGADVARFTFLGELFLIFWLLLKGRRITRLG